MAVMAIRAARWFERCFLASLGLVVALAAWWLYIEPDPLVVHGGEVQTPIVARGDYIQVEWRAEKRSQCPAEAKYFIRDGQGNIWQLPGAGGFNPVGDGSIKIVRYRVKIPEAAEDGPAEFWETVTYRCNPLREHVIVKPRLKFTIAG
ncbi:MAG: hypothetical protein D6722_01555 [Bacteroidetes bacterium]|nr:MAG: hypothetical protein D6722_01555 [Bacteroidota bacterium]